MDGPFDILYITALHGYAFKKKLNFFYFKIILMCYLKINLKIYFSAILNF